MSLLILISIAMENKQNRQFYIDMIRAYATFLVVFSHVFAPLVWAYNTTSEPVWLVMNVCDALIRPCVPLFVMISGALLLNPSREESISLFLKKRLTKILVPLILWSLIYELILIRFLFVILGVCL